mgnify:FL=1
MPWTTLIFLGLTLIFWRLTQVYSDEAICFLSNFATVACLIVGLATAPILLKSTVLLFLLITPSFIAQNRNFS